ncbi:DUF541 domain-containing protein [Rhodococcus sp. ABRD24]|uniref:SIMPL domain-containing protein n=1 Tax=Rhodococcus sp. ABRD24 TaxID=2507582 RepID=UPI001038A3C1|nr:SIMPL domain-containing protein [Rhodococcus sp. ABRD24]QBJ98301.1 DUF541 domain-containing protein [Rhodococcus sp. ABRD24]
MHLPRTNRLLGAIGASTLCVLTLVGCSSSDAPASTTDSTGITTRGVGKVTGTPDTLTVVLGVETRGPEANGTLAANAEKASALIETLKGRGVAPEDIQTSGLSVQPTYESGSGRINGYQVTNQVTATLHDLGGAGSLIDAAASAAGDAVRVQQTTFSIDDDSDLRAQARAAAVQQAQAQAKQIADAGGVKLGSIRSITEVPPNQIQPDPFMRTPSPNMAFDMATPVAAGSQELSVNVAVVYDID